jgi:hypothetical protein
VVLVVEQALANKKADSPIYPSIENRSGEPIELLKIFEDLTIAQKVALSELGHYGYDLTFISQTDEGPLAVAMYQ